MKPVLETMRLKLRPWNYEDAADMYMYAKSDKVGPMAGWKPHSDIEESRKIIKKFIAEDDTWAIEYKPSKKIIGSIGLHRSKRSAVEYDYELGYALSEDYWGNGIIPEAAAEIIEYAFDILNIKTLMCAHFTSNNQSRRVIEKLGFIHNTRIDKSWHRFDGEDLDEEIYLMDKVCYNAAKKRYAALGAKTKKLGFGLMRLPLLAENEYKNVDIEKAKKMVDAFIDNGFTYFDTAYIYHGGLGEKITKKILVDRYPREIYTLATKLPCMILKSAGDNEKFFAEQLNNLGVEYFDYYLLHSLGGESYIDAEKYNCFEFCQNKKKEGRIKHFGFSFHDSPELLDKILTDHPYADFVQLQINYLDWESASIKSKQCYDICSAHGKPVIVMEPVKGGTLANLPDNAETLIRNYNESASASSWAIRFAASLSNVMTVLSGMSDIPQMNDNIKSMRDFVPLNDDERRILHKITDILNADGSIPCTGCNYCTGVCRQGIKIPYLFAAYNDDLKSKNDQFSIQNTMYRHYSATNKSAADCLGCRACEKVCPQHLPIAKLLSDVKNHFGC